MHGITVSEVATGSYGAWRMFLRDRSGAQYFGDDAASFWKSFWAAAVVLPGYFILQALGDRSVWDDAGLFRLISVEVIFYSISWTLWPVLMAVCLSIIDRDDRYVRYIVAHNWSSVPAVYFLTLIGLVTTLFGIEGGAEAFVYQVAVIWLLIYHGFIIATVLETPMGATIALVIGEFIAGLFINGFRLSMLSPA